VPLLEDLPLDRFARIARESTAAFPTRVRLAFETPQHVVKTATSFAELRQAFELRHAVFIEEGLGRRLASGMDVDAYDVDSDHLQVIDKGSARVVGNYRVRCSLFHRRFYSEGEFLLDDFLREGAVKIEVGRACVDPRHRGGLVLQLLWRGLREYVRRTAARYVFGCSSVPAGVPGRVEAVWDELVASGRVSGRFPAVPRVPFVLGPGRFRGPAMPPLLASYLRLGASVLGTPAFDAALNCADFLTLLDLRDVPASLLRSYDAHRPRTP
jgi:putative hemolysin